MKVKHQNITSQNGQGQNIIKSTHTVSALRMHLASVAAASAKLGHWKQCQNRGVKQKYFYKCYFKGFEPKFQRVRTKIVC